MFYWVIMKQKLLVYIDDRICDNVNVIYDFVFWSLFGLKCEGTYISFKEIYCKKKMQN